MVIYIWGSEKKIIQKNILMWQETVLCLSTLKICNWFFSILDPFFIVLSHNFAWNGLLWVLYRKGTFISHPGCPLLWLVGLWIPSRSRKCRQTYWLMDLHLALKPSYQNKNASASPLVEKPHQTSWLGHQVCFKKICWENFEKMA